jgi:hypothetical protein
VFTTSFASTTGSSTGGSTSVHCYNITKDNNFNLLGKRFKRSKLGQNNNNNNLFEKGLSEASWAKITTTTTFLKKV